jgi:NAD(P)-dependent dehydrogenase (short-subunit alcohol dehydrogenase family)
MSLAGKRIAVTGAFGSLGAAVVQAARGARAFGGVDLADTAQAKTAIDDAARALGGLDALVNIAGTFRWETLAKGSPDTWDFLYRVNLRTAVAASKAALAHLPDGGRIVNIGAAGALKAGAGMGAYAASKSGVMRFTESLAEELKPRGITVNAVLPSIIDTPPNRKDMPEADFGKWVKPAQLADVIVFLLSDRASAITGALIPVVGRV